MTQPYERGDEVAYLSSDFGTIEVRRGEVKDISGDRIQVYIAALEQDGPSVSHGRYEWHEVNARGHGDLVVPLTDEIAERLRNSEDGSIFIRGEEEHLLNLDYSIDIPNDEEEEEQYDQIY